MSTDSGKQEAGAGGFEDLSKLEASELVQRAQAGNAEALGELFARYYAVMVESARRKLGPRLRQREDPDDLAQTTFREATRDFAKYEHRGEAALLRWLMQILQNKIRDRAEHWGASKRDTSKEVSLSAGSSDEDGSAAIHDPASRDLSVTGFVQRKERAGRLEEALAELPDEYREAITLVFFQGKSLREAGEQLGGRTEDALRMMLRRAEAKLRDKLKGSVGKDFDGEGPAGGK